MFLIQLHLIIDYSALSNQIDNQKRFEVALI